MGNSLLLRRRALMKEGTPKYNLIVLANMDIRGEDKGWDLIELTDEGLWRFGKNIYILPTFNGCSWLVELHANKSVMTPLNLSLYFNGCINLKLIDIEEWDTSNVTSFASTFKNCKNLNLQNIEKLITNNVTSLYYTFLGSGALKIDLSKWNVSKVKDMTYAFYGCSNLSELILRDWDLASAKTMALFRNCSRLQTLDLSGWKNLRDDIPSLSWSLSFQGCNTLTTIYMRGCSQDTIDKISAVKPYRATIITE